MATKGSKKKATKKSRRKPLFADDPPIIVGGGGSTYIWIRNDKTVTFVADTSTIKTPPPKNPNKYYVLKVDVDTTKVDADNGKGGAGNHAGHATMDKDKHRTVFE